MSGERSLTAQEQAYQDAHNAGACSSACPFHAEDVHAWFGLSYANYAVLPRTLLQAMPGHWQLRFVALMGEYEEAVAGIEVPLEYEVRIRDEEGRYRIDPVPHYRHAPRSLDRLREGS